MKPTFWNWSFFKKRVISNPPLLTRWILFRCPSFGIYIHKFHRSDYDRALHDHPWPFVVIVLKGGYMEYHNQTRDGVTEIIDIEPGNVLLRPASWRHRVVLNVDGKGNMIPSWSLVIVGRRCQQWGFFLKKGWCWWRKYDQDKEICADEIIHHGGSD